MKACIIGWYGTETIGDRGILAGIISMLAEYDKKLSLNLGSLYPFFSKRTLREDAALYNKLAGYSIETNLFDSTKKDDLHRAIHEADVLIMGGGPLMDLPEMYMVRYAFKYAKKCGKRTIVFGCGVGPLFHKETQLCALDIMDLTDYIILRDSVSYSNIHEIADCYHRNLEDKKIHVGFDPAVECVYKSKKIIAKEQHWYKNKTVAVNLRDFPLEYLKDRKALSINNINVFFVNLLNSIRDYDKIPVLIPMHYFSAGNDDRLFLHNLCMSNRRLSDVFVQNHPLSLLETIRKFYEADVVVGMRFHSVVFQTIVNGRNFVLDYTESGKGKINGFMKDFFKNIDYQSRYSNLQVEIPSVKTLVHQVLSCNRIDDCMIDEYYKIGRNEYEKMLVSLT